MFSFTDTKHPGHKAGIFFWVKKNATNSMYMSVVLSAGTGKALLLFYSIVVPLKFIMLG